VSFDTTSLIISPPLRRPLAVVLLVAVIGLIALDIVLPAIERYTTLEGTIAENETVLRRFQQVAARLPRLEADRASLKQALSAQDGYLKATSDSLIAAEMQGLIKTIADRSGSQLKSTQILPAHEQNGFRRVTARVEIVGTADALERIWYAMESGVPFLFVDTFDIEARPVQRKDRSAPPMIALDVRFVVSAYARAAVP
jgi:Tfp pilus assembly protein PilO